MKKLLMTVCTALLLTGCLQVELHGPVEGASIQIAPLRSGDTLVSGLRTDGVDQARQANADSWDEWPDIVRLMFFGFVQVPEDKLEDDRLYLVTATGGVDRDWNLDGQIDAPGVPVARDLHAIMTGAQLKLKPVRVSVLSEAIYQYLLPRLDSMSDGQLVSEMDRLAARMVTDANGDEQTDYLDLLFWSRRNPNVSYLGPNVYLERASRGLQAADYSDEVVFADAVNVVEGAALRAFSEDSSYSDSLAACLGAVTFGDLCDFGTLPPLGWRGDVPTVQDVMDRLVVSHDWMAERFESFLRILPADLLLLFRSITTVTMSADIRPAYYQPATGGIYLDAQYFWVTAQERDSVSTQADFRAAFGSSLSFADLWTYVDRNNVPLVSQADENGNQSPTIVALIAAQLLFHELAHAADSMPAADWPTWDTDDTPLDVSTSQATANLSSRFPLRSPELHSMADVLYRGLSPTATQRNYSGSDIGIFFSNDAASDLYAYSTPYEDVAMLMEEAMMALHFGLRRDLVFTTAPPSGVTPMCEHFQVGWGVRGRVKAPVVLPRAQQVVGDLLPERNYLAALLSLPNAQQLPAGGSWCDIYFATRPASASSLSTNANRPMQGEFSRHLARPH